MSGTSFRRSILDSSFNSSAPSPSSAARRLLATALLVGAAATGCDGGDNVDLAARELNSSPNKEFYVGHYVRRESRGDCQPSCAKWVEQWTEKPSGKRVKVRRCVEKKKDCPSFRSNVLYAQPGTDELASGLPDFPDNPKLGTIYYGCGPKAAQNVLGYFGVREPINGIPSPPYYVKTVNTGQLSFYFTDGIATTPDELTSGLQRALNEVADGTFKVTRKTGISVLLEVTRAIDAGFPIIVLADNGAHYLTVTGYDLTKNSLLVNDYPYSDGTVQPARWVALSDDLLNFDTSFSAGIHPGGWDDNTVVTIERTGGAAPTSGLFKASNHPAIYALNGKTACSLTWDQYVALHQPSFNTMTPHQADNFKKSYDGSRACTNREAGLP
jgi:hypothetical protein